MRDGLEGCSIFPRHFDNATLLGSREFVAHGRSMLQQAYRFCEAMAVVWRLARVRLAPMTEPTLFIPIRQRRAQGPDVFLAFVLLVVVYRIGILLTLDIPLFYDEAYYFGWPRNSLRYFSKPPRSEHCPNNTHFRQQLGGALKQPDFTLSRRFLFGAPVYCGSMRKVRPGRAAYS